MRYRVVRILGLVTVLALIGGGFAIADTNPVAWAKSRWTHLTNAQERVDRVTAIEDPPGCRLLSDVWAPGGAVDGLDETAWARNWNPTLAPTGECDVTLGGALLVVLPEQREVTGLSILAGLPEGDKLIPEQWRPTKLNLRFSDGSTQDVTLHNRDTPESVEIDPIFTKQIRIAIVDGIPPTAVEKNGAKVAITQVTVLARPK